MRDGGYKTTKNTASSQLSGKESKLITPTTNTPILQARNSRVCLIFRKYLCVIIIIDAYKYKAE